MKILHVAERFYPIIGGAEMQALQLIKGQLDKGVEAHFLARKVDPKLSDFEEIEGIKVFRLDPKGLNTSKYEFAWNVYRFIKKRRGDYDFVHVHGIYSLLGMACVLAGKTVVGKITSSRVDLKENPFIRFVKLLVLRRIDKIIATTQQIKKELDNMGFTNDQISMIPNGVDTEKFKPNASGNVRKQLGLPEDKLIAAFSGNLVKVKGLDMLAEAMREVVKKHPNLLLLLFGTGKLQYNSLEEYLKKFIEENQLEENIKLMGKVWNMHEYLQACDFFFFPSRKEGLSNSLLEAASSGLGIVASDLPGNAEAIGYGGGLLFTSGSTQDLTQKILQLLENGTLRAEMGKEARKTIVDKYSSDVVCESYLRLYGSLIT